MTSIEPELRDKIKGFLELDFFIFVGGRLHF
jgi:hypothetical protein